MWSFSHADQRYHTPSRYGFVRRSVFFRTHYRQRRRWPQPFRRGRLLEKMLAGKMNLLLVRLPPTVFSLALGRPGALANKDEQFGYFGCCHKRDVFLRGANDGGWCTANRQFPWKHQGLQTTCAGRLKWRATERHFIGRQTSLHTPWYGLDKDVLFQHEALAFRPTLRLKVRSP
jgi:hypothetical protein